MTMRYVQVYSRFERLWHWLQAVCILLLLATGLEIHSPGVVPYLGFAGAIQLHEWLAVLLVANAFLSLFYHLATGALKKFIPEPRDFFSLAVNQARYYLRDIFQGGAHPLVKAQRGRLNVLQQVTYVLLLNVALPLQVVTGILLWKAESWGGVVDRLGGLHVIAQIHVAMAWAMGSFIIMHVYLTTTGRTPLAHMKSMIFGVEELEEKVVESTDQNERHAETIAASKEGREHA